MNKSITQATQNDKQISNLYQKIFYKIPCLNATVPKKWNSLQESMITQSMHIVFGFGCLLLDGQMEVHLCW